MKRTLQLYLTQRVTIILIIKGYSRPFGMPVENQLY